MRIIVHGATGRVGARLCELIVGAQDMTLVGAGVSATSASIGSRSVRGDDDSPILENADDIAVLADVVIDFSRANAVSSAIACAQRAGAALLVATTGLTRESVDALRREAADRAVLVAPNTALGVSVMVRIASEAARMLGADFSASIVEAHHSGKRDAPSGTALRLADALSKAGASIDSSRIHAIRAGDTIGEHTIRFDGPGETIEITHRAVSRDLFALGALRAARWLAGRGAGWWTMEDVAGFGAS